MVCIDVCSVMWRCILLSIVSCISFVFLSCLLYDDLWANFYPYYFVVTNVGTSTDKHIHVRYASDKLKYICV